MMFLQGQQGKAFEWTSSQQAEKRMVTNDGSHDHNDPIKMRYLQGTLPYPASSQKDLPAAQAE